MAHPIQSRLYGASDDLVECEGSICGEICSPTKPVEVLIESADGAQTLLVFAYEDPGVWRVRVGQTEEDRDMVPVQIGHHSSGYSAVVVVEGDVTVGWRKAGGDKWKAPS